MAKYIAYHLKVLLHISSTFNNLVSYCSLGTHQAAMFEIQGLRGYERNRLERPGKRWFS